MYAVFGMLRKYPLRLAPAVGDNTFPAPLETIVPRFIPEALTNEACHRNRVPLVSEHRADSPQRPSRWRCEVGECANV